MQRRVIIMCAVILLCSTHVYALNLDFVPYSDSKYEKKTKDTNIELFFGEDKPSRQYKVIGEIVGNVKKASEVRQELQREARKVGGDAVVGIQIQQNNPAGGDMVTTLIAKQWVNVNAKVIVYTDSESKP